MGVECSVIRLREVGVAALTTKDHDLAKRLVLWFREGVDMKIAVIADQVFQQGGYRAFLNDEAEKSVRHKDGVPILKPLCFGSLVALLVIGRIQKEAMAAWPWEMDLEGVALDKCMTSAGGLLCAGIVEFGAPGLQVPRGGEGGDGCAVAGAGIKEYAVPWHGHGGDVGGDDREEPVGCRVKAKFGAPFEVHEKNLS